MRRLLIFLTLALAAGARADDLARRLEPFGEHLTSAVYDTYPSGRARLVVVGVAAHASEVLLVRFPDDDSGTPVTVDRDFVFDPPRAIRFERVIGARDAVVDMVTYAGKKFPDVRIYRILGEQLVFIGDPHVYSGLITADLDHDGVPELITTALSDETLCGATVLTGICVFNGKEYFDDGRHYVSYTAGTAGRRAEGRFWVGGDAEHIVHIALDGGATSARVAIDGAGVADGQHIALSGGRCHAVSVSVRGAKAAKAHVFIETLAP